MPMDGPERRRPAGWGLALINGYSFGNAAGTANAEYFLQKVPHLRCSLLSYPFIPALRPGLLTTGPSGLMPALHAL